MVGSTFLVCLGQFLSPDEFQVIMTDKMTGKPRGFGFIVFENSDSVTAVLQVQEARNCGEGALLAFCWDPFSCPESWVFLGEDTMLS